MAKIKAKNPVTGGVFSVDENEFNSGVYKGWTKVGGSTASPVTASPTYYKDGQVIDPTQYSNLGKDASGVMDYQNQDFQNYLTEQGISSTLDTSVAAQSALSITADNANIIDSDTLNSSGLDFEATAGPTPVAMPVIPGQEGNIPEAGATQMTPGEQKQQGFVEQLEDLYSDLEGESAFRTEQEDAQGLSGMIQSQIDLTNQINTLQAESAALPLQLEQDAARRGITTNILSGQQASALRKNAIAALGVSALLQATQGNISTAQSLVDRKVAAKYDPIKEQINTAIRNLELIQNSPQYSLEQKDRAQAQLEIQNAKAKAVAKAEETETNVSNLAINAASLIQDAPALNAINNAPNEIEAYQIAGRLMEGGWEYVNTPLKRDQLASQGYEIYVNEALGRTYARPSEEIAPVAISGGGGGGTTETTEKPMSTNQIEQFRRSYGWTPPAGYSWNQLVQYIEDNPDATPEQLESGIKDGEVVAESEQYSDEWFQDKVSVARTENFSDEEIIDFLLKNITEDELFKIAKEKGFAKWYSGKRTDIKRFIESF